MKWWKSVFAILLMATPLSCSYQKDYVKGQEIHSKARCVAALPLVNLTTHPHAGRIVGDVGLAIVECSGQRCGAAKERIQSEGQGRAIDEARRQRQLELVSHQPQGSSDLASLRIREHEVGEALADLGAGALPVGQTQAPGMPERRRRVEAELVSLDGQEASTRPAGTDQTFGDPSP